VTGRRPDNALSKLTRWPLLAAVAIALIVGVVAAMVVVTGGLCPSSGSTNRDTTSIRASPNSGSSASKSASRVAADIRCGIAGMGEAMASVSP
jgi:hypothetical protein